MKIMERKVWGKGKPYNTEVAARGHPKHKKELQQMLEKTKQE